MHDNEKHNKHESGCSPTKREPKEKLVLGFMIGHNGHHSAELRDLADKFAAAGNGEASALVLEALKDFEAGNEKLSRALDAL